MAKYIGIDISKDTLDVDLPGGVVRYAQTPTDHARLLAALPAEAIVGIEATARTGCACWARCIRPSARCA